MIKQHPLKYISLFIFIYTIFPFLVLCFFNVPIGDDFWYADAFRTHGFWQTQSNFYTTWSGRYISTAAISGLNPVSYGYFDLAFIHPLILITGFAWALRRLIAKTTKNFRLAVNPDLLFSLLFFFYFNYVPDFGETFYWMAGAFTYQLPIVFFLLYLSTIIDLFQTDSAASKVKFQFVALCCLFVVLGCNEVLVVYTNILNILIMVVLLSNRDYVNRFTPIVAITAVISFMMISAPGNFVRSEMFVKSDFHFLKAVGQALSRSLFVLFFWVPALCLMLLFLANETYIANSRAQNVFAFLRARKFLFASALLFLLGITFIGFFPSIYATNWIPQRAYTPIFFSLILATSPIFLGLVPKIEWLSQVNKALSERHVSSVLLPLLIIGLSQNSNVMNAYVDITSGKAYSYHKQVVATYEMLRDYKKDTVVIGPIHKKPLILPYRWPGGNGLVNGELADYFKIREVQSSGGD